MNGVVNFSVLDGWWLEGYREGAGWALTENHLPESGILRPAWMPLPFTASSNRKSCRCIMHATRRDIRRLDQNHQELYLQIAPHLTMKRQLDDYYSKVLHEKEAKRFKALAANNYAKAKEPLHGRKKLRQDGTASKSYLGKRRKNWKGSSKAVRNTITITLSTKGSERCHRSGIGSYLYSSGRQKYHVYSVAPFQCSEEEGRPHTFQATHKLENAGSFKVAYRMFRRMQNCLTVRTSAMFAGSSKIRYPKTDGALVRNASSVDKRRCVKMQHVKPRLSHQFSLLPKDSVS